MFNILGQDTIKDLFKKSIERGAISHSYLIEGEWGLGKMEMAKFIAGTLLCLNNDYIEACGVCSNCRKVNTLNHPDVNVIDEKTIKIDNIRDAIGEVHKKPYEGQKKVLIIKNFHTATIESQNAILKTLEEPPETATLILLAENALSILDTIKSRCQILKMFRVDPSLVKKELLNKGINESVCEFASNYSEGNIGIAGKACTEEFLSLREEIINMAISIFTKGKYTALRYGEALTKYKDNINEVLDIFTSVYRDIIMLKIGRNDSRIINKDKIEILVEESYRLSYNKLEQSLNVIKSARNSLTRDTNFQLTMEVMIMGIQNGR